MSHADRSRFFFNKCAYFCKIFTQIVLVRKKKKKERKIGKEKNGKEKKRKKREIVSNIVLFAF